MRVLVYRRYSGRQPVDLDDLMFADPERLGEPAGLRPFFAYGRTKTCLRDWRTTARALSDPMRQAILTAPGDNDYAEVDRPRE